MTPRVASSILVGALLKRAESEGGFGAVLAKGDPNSGAVAVILRERHGITRFFERVLQPDGGYAWEDSEQEAENQPEFEKFLERRRRFDPDMWIVELDIVSAERFAAEMNSFG